jgi:subtilisin family serine protease
MKPDLVAPGFNVYSSVPNSGHEEMSGTSMAAPHVTGAFTILLQAHPQATAAQIRAAMIHGAEDLGSPGMDNDFGWGRPDLIRSLDLLH